MGRSKLIFVLLFVFCACGKSKTTTGKKIVPIDPEEIELALDNQDIRCESVSGGPCPSGIARLFILDPAHPETSAVCTGFMVSNDVLLTNNHCVPSSEKCGDTFIAISDQGRITKARCKDVILTESSGEISRERKNDITIMHIDANYTGPRFAIAPSRVTPVRPVNLWVVDQIDLFQASITELNCEYDSKPGALELHDCPVIAGNSGSPIVIPGTQSAMGIIWGSTLPPDIDASFPLPERRQLPSIGLGTELFPFIPVINAADSNPR